MTNTGIRSKEESVSIENPEQVETEENLEGHVNSEKEDNQSVKLAMAAELVEMGISKSSAHKILNIRET